MLVLVRCLGPGSKEHWFYSKDPCRHRICSKCTTEISRMHLPKQFEMVVTIPVNKKGGDANART